MTNVVILDGARTAIGTFGGSLAGVPPIDLGAAVAKEAVGRSGIEPDMIGHVAFGHVINTEPRDMYLSRVAAIDAGIPDSVPAMNVNRLCGSGIQSIVSVVQSLRLGDAEFGLAGGAESMSRSPYSVQSARWGQKMGDTRAIDMMTGALSCPFGTGHMGVTAEIVAEEHGISREDQDEFALESQRRASEAIEEGRFREQILPFEVRVRRETLNFDTDEHPKPTSEDALASLRAVFKKGGTVTAGNASGINDGAAAIVLAREDSAEKCSVEPKAKILGYAHAGVRPETMGIGPVPAVRKLLDETGLSIGDFDVIESNEAFAAQAVAVARSLDFDPGKVNPNGGAIALGHPIGATGTIIVLKALYELKRTGGKKALATMCIGGGQGIALAIESI
ncbi:MAG: acetyl-CoA C-acyltransferase family protein [Albidovulum sp.]|nr:acetyl-CoA C-acyltransferase family protein [Albidovulum sp.]MDE0305206.1 acetyl-CoA C-acyltransferase family protein [Albidovulum sp.]MDE0534149.1 acetyl-CoA C-acyltransferase family protein [Albidovulum sp.]